MRTGKEADERKQKRRGNHRKQSGGNEAEHKVSTSRTAVGAKLGGAKGNKRKAKYTEPEGRHGKPGRKEGEKT